MLSPIKSCCKAFFIEKDISLRLNTERCSVNTIQYSVYTLQSTLYIVQNALKYNVYCIQGTRIKKKVTKFMKALKRNKRRKPYKPSNRR